SAGAGDPGEQPDAEIALAVDDDTASVGGDEPPAPGDRPMVTVRYSPTEALRHKDFAAYSSAELREARRLMAHLRLAGALRRSRRARPARGGRGRPDLRRTVRA